MTGAAIGGHGEAVERLCGLTAVTAAEEIRRGHITSEELTRACLDRIEAIEGRVGAWAFIDADHALDQARAADRAMKAGDPLGALHGVPVGIKDVFDTADMPCAYGTVLHAGRMPTEDAAVVGLLRGAGAVIVGKTVTTELAVARAGKTTNPHDPARTPGGSSSGSAAAVACGMVPLALGSQTNGSIIRPASFCGVVGFKPSHGLIPRHGALHQSRTFDQIGVFARTVEDAALMAEPLMAFDPRDPDTRPRARPRLLETARADPPVGPRLAFVRSPVWGEAADGTRAAFERLAESLRGHVRDVALPAAFDEAVAAHRTIMEADLAVSLADEHARGREHLSAALLQILDRGQRYPAVAYLNAVVRVAELNAALDALLGSYDAILTPAAPGVAPVGQNPTGSPIFCTIWTLCGTPAVSLPLLRGEAGLPLGVQLVGRRGDDARLLRTARWLCGAARGSPGGGTGF